MLGLAYRIPLIGVFRAVFRSRSFGSVNRLRVLNRLEAPGRAELGSALSIAWDAIDQRPRRLRG
jgi:hypothetical protein